MTGPTPCVPKSLHPLAREALEELRSFPEAASIIVGGGVALQHYCEFRETVDLDAWWEGPVRPEAQAAIRGAMGEIARRHGYRLTLRSWRETESYELSENERKVFSFQIAQRSVQLEPSLPSAWPPVKIESFRDNVGAKMNALVDRGAPRDLVDIYELSVRGLLTAKESWDLWRLKNPGKSVTEARLQVLHHVEAIEARRPLDRIRDPREQESAKAVRAWIRGVLSRGGEP